MLEIENLNVFFGKAHILRDVSVSVDALEIVAVVGANGAGKTTLLNTISRFNDQKSGSVFFDGVCLDRISYPSTVEMGLIQVPEGRMVFPSLTVLENLELGAFHKTAKRQREKTLGEVYRIFPILEERRKQAGGTLSGGEQQMLAIGRGLMSLPRLLMLDEPSLGLGPLIVQTMFNVIREINQNKVTILLVEQNVRKALTISSRGYVLENGVISLQGTGDGLLKDEHMKKAFLGL
jgi:branched-chain amino acid transport system ATP-binding protein